MNKNNVLKQEQGEEKDKIFVIIPFSLFLASNKINSSINYKRKYKHLKAIIELQ
jgi:hypothetical protein